MVPSSVVGRRATGESMCETLKERQGPKPDSTRDGHRGADRHLHLLDDGIRETGRPLADRLDAIHDAADPRSNLAEGSDDLARFARDAPELTDEHVPIRCQLRELVRSLAEVLHDPNDRDGDHHDRDGYNYKTSL